MVCVCVCVFVRLSVRVCVSYELGFCLLLLLFNFFFSLCLYVSCVSVRVFFVYQKTLLAPKHAPGCKHLLLNC